MIDNQWWTYTPSPEEEEPIEPSQPFIEYHPWDIELAAKGMRRVPGGERDMGLIEWFVGPMRVTVDCLKWMYATLDDSEDKRPWEKSNDNQGVKEGV